MSILVSVHSERIAALHSPALSSPVVLTSSVLFYPPAHAEAAADYDRFAEGGSFGQEVAAAGELLVCGKYKVALRYQGIETAFIGNLLQ
jgi:hypothetical protein